MPRRALLLVLLGLGAVLLTHIYVASRSAAIDLAFIALLGFVLFPRFCRAVLILLVIVGPVFNPPVLGIGAGRLYLVQALLVGVSAGGLVVGLRNGLDRAAITFVALTVLLVAVQTIGRPTGGPAWVYRPLQVFFVAFAVRSLFRRGDGRHLVLALAYGSVAGCTLASIHAILPSLDPFVLSRPKDLPFVSAIGSYARATGAFTYPNNLGTFAAYAVVFGASAWLLHRPILPPRLAVALMASGAAALTLAGSRAAGLGLLCGLLYLTAKAAPKRRAVILVAEAVFGLLVVAVVLTSPTAVEVAGQRAQAGASFFGRVDAVTDALAGFVKSPLIGTGATELNLDNFVLLYVIKAGLVGAVLLAAIAGTVLRSREPKQYPELWVALLIALCTSGMLQDSLGQTLVTWFLGALLGVSMLQPRTEDPPPVTRPEAAPQRAASTR